MRAVGAFIVSLLLLGPVGPARALEIQTALGPVSIAVPPRTIAVFDLAAVDTLAALGVKQQGLPSNLYLAELAPLQKGAAKVGTLFEPDLEALSALGPDLIILGGRSSPHLASVRRVAPAIDMSFSGSDLLAEAKLRLTTYGALFGKEAAATALARELDQAIAATRAAAQGKGRALILMANGPKISAYGPGSRFGWLHSELGVPAAAETSATAVHGEIVSFEFVRKADPDWLIVLDRSAAIGEAGGGAQATLANDLVAQTKAGQRGQILYLPPADFYIAAGGISATLRVLASLKAGFAAAP
ncbi:iron ABC transporter substrate-binding protein [Elstera litoralis]|uniref:Iron ABC transporter substrate-binding protein n=1 Tax=Elstera litoralis TaxID=552518 RepID=A0A0F3IV09_9PROT|nr:siderophore ABC transporter substrate-binding protein [Elstera litoralis]KJV10550.1 iron ABC transporter substrate-binding protein [Elstera litoralis]